MSLQLRLLDCFSSYVSHRHLLRCLRVASQRLDCVRARRMLRVNCVCERLRCVPVRRQRRPLLRDLAFLVVACAIWVIAVEPHIPFFCSSLLGTGLDGRS